MQNIFDSLFLFPLQNLFSFCMFRAICWRQFPKSQSVALLHLLHSKTPTECPLSQTVISKMLYYECPWKIDYHVSVGLPSCIYTVLYNKNNDMLCSKVQPCLLHVIKYLGTLGLEFVSFNITHCM